MQRCSIAEDFIAGAAVVDQFTDVAIKDYKRLIAIADVATITGTAEGFTAAGRQGTGDPVEIGLTALSRSGIQFTMPKRRPSKRWWNPTKHLAQNYILKELEKQYGNNSKAAATGYACAQDSWASAGVM